LHIPGYVNVSQLRLRSEKFDDDDDDDDNNNNYYYYYYYLSVAS
jgi:hypothetical protein